MISSKKIYIIAIVLVCGALIFTLAAMYMHQSSVSNEITGEHVFSEQHKINYDSTDFYTDYASSSPVKITLKGDTASSASRNVSVNGNEVTIHSGGTYVLSGTLTDGSITVDSADDVPVRLILNGANITSENSAAICVNQAEKVVLSTSEGTENTLADGETRSDGTVTAALYSKDDLTINGSGTLIVNGNYNDAIKCNDDLKITEGTLVVTAADDGINANNYIGTLEADISVKAGGDAIKCEYTDDTSKGFAAFENTTVNIEAGDDGICVSGSLYICNADISIPKCVEGLEGAYITINGGNIDIVSSDDGINAVGLNSAGGFGGRPMGTRGNKTITEDDIYLTVNSGKIRIETGGDGLDSNGAVTVNGGDIEVYGPENNGNSSLDFEYQFKIDGGSIIAAGSSGMAEAPAENSKQNSIVFYLTESYEAGSEIVLKDAEGKEIKTASPTKNFNWVCISNADIVTGGEYTLLINGNEAGTVQISDIVTTYGGRSFGR